MTEAFAVVIVSIFVTVTIAALMVVINLLFPQLVDDGRQVADRLPGRAFIFGLLNGFFLTVLTVICFAIADNGVAIFYLPGFALLALTSVSISFGLTSIALLIGQRMFPGRSLLHQLMAGAVTLTLACLVPFVGWFGLLPFVVTWGLGATALGIYQRRWPVVVVKSADIEGS